MTTDHDTRTTRKYKFLVGKDRQDGGTIREQNLKQKVAETFPQSGANIQETGGIWKGCVESGAYEIKHIDLSGDFSREQAREVREKFEREFGQEMVLATVDEVETV